MLTNVFFFYSFSTIKERFLTIGLHKHIHSTNAYMYMNNSCFGAFYNGHIIYGQYVIHLSILCRNSLTQDNFDFGFPFSFVSLYSLTIYSYICIIGIVCLYEMRDGFVYRRKRCKIGVAFIGIIYVRCFKYSLSRLIDSALFTVPFLMVGIVYGYCFSVSLSRKVFPIWNRKISVNIMIKSKR